MICIDIRGNARLMEHSFERTDGVTVWVEMVRLAPENQWAWGMEWRNEISFAKPGSSMVTSQQILTVMNNPRACMFQFGDIVAAHSAKP